MASIAMWSAPQFKAHTHILVNTTNKNRSIVKEMQEPLTSPFYWVLFGLMLLFLVRALNSIRAWRFAFMPSTSFIRYSQPSELSTLLAMHSKCICPNATQTTRAPDTARRLPMGPMPGCHLVYACFPISLALEEGASSPHSQLLLTHDCSRVLAIAY